MTTDVSSYRRELGERIAIVRGNRSQPKFARELGVSKNTIIRYEKGVGVPDLELAVKICEQNNINLAWLAYGIEPMRPDQKESCGPDLPVNRKGHMLSQFPGFEPGLLDYIYKEVSKYTAENGIELSREQFADVTYLAYNFCQESNSTEAGAICHIFSTWAAMSQEERDKLYY